MNYLTYRAAIRWVAKHRTSDYLNPDELESVFLAITGQAPTEQDFKRGLMSICVECVMLGTTPDGRDVYVHDGYTPHGVCMKCGNLTEDLPVGSKNVGCKFCGHYRLGLVY